MPPPVGRREFLSIAGATVAGAASVSLLAGCAAPSTASPSASSSPARLGAHLTAALRADDHETFAAVFLSRQMADLWFANLRLFTDVTVDVLPGGVRSAGEEVGEIAVSWSVPGDPGPSLHRVPVTLATDTDRPVGSVVGTSRPLWAAEPLALVLRGDVTLLTGPGVPGDDWATAGRQAVADVTGHCPEELRAGWNGHLVVAIAAATGSFAAALDVPVDGYRSVAAVARTDGPDPTSPARVYVNHPACRALAPVDRRVLLAHEGCHVATRDVTRSAPHWLSEGLAEYVGLSGSLGHRDYNVELVRRRIRSRGLPESLPTEALFAPAAADLPTAYALADQAVRAVFDRAGDKAAVDFVKAVGTGSAATEADWPIPPATVTRWYLDRLGSL
jgi:hypothetical protein